MYVPVARTMQGTKSTHSWPKLTQCSNIYFGCWPAPTQIWLGQILVFFLGKKFLNRKNKSYSNLDAITLFEFPIEYIIIFTYGGYHSKHQTNLRLSTSYLRESHMENPFTPFNLMVNNGEIANAICDMVVSSDWIGIPLWWLKINTLSFRHRCFESVIERCNLHEININKHG